VGETCLWATAGKDAEDEEVLGLDMSLYDWSWKMMDCRYRQKVGGCEARFGLSIVMIVGSYGRCRIGLCKGHYSKTSV
jgi:hypothetical protein